MKEHKITLKDSEAKYRDLFENADDPMYTIDTGGFFKTINKAGLKILGGREEDIIGSHISKWLTPESLKSSQAVMGKQFSGETWDVPVLIEVVSCDGTHKWGEARTRIIREGDTITGIHGVVRDITEKIRLEEQLKESESRYRDLFENADDPMYTISMDGIFQTINNSGCKVLGAGKKEIIGTHISRWLTPDSFEAAKQRIKKHMSSVKIEEPVVYELICYDGKHRWAEIRTRPIKEGDRITGIHGIGRDITEKIKTEQKLIESEAKYRELFENANDGMYTHDINGFFLTINDAGCKILECSTKEEIIGTHISRWLTPESLEIAREVIRKYTTGDTVKQPILLELVSRNKKHLIVEFRNRLIKDKGRIIAIHGIARDITEKIILENNLKESELRYRDLFENAQDPMFVVDTEDRFLKMNRAGLDTLGCSFNEMEGSHISKWITPESYKVYLERRAACFLDKPRKSMEIFEVICKNGEHRWIEVKTRAIKKGGKITEIHCIGRDMTEKMRLEQRVKDYHEKLERSYTELLESERIKSEFISNITHELLTPLTSIKGFVELLDDETMGRINSEQKKSLEIINRNSDRLIRLIKELLDTSNLENNKLGMEFKLISLNSILAKSIQDIYPHAKDKKIVIYQEIQILPEIWGDDERLTQVIMNLLINAIKFTHSEGRITIKAKDDSDHVKISVSDTGIGIPADKLKVIFERFYQVDGSSSRKYGGVGIGLSICKSIIEKHYGSIWAQSDGHGSTFHIVLPKIMSTGERHV